MPTTTDDADLRETLDLLGTLMASVSDRVDKQREALDRVAKTAAEARQAAFAARAQTDPKLFAEPVGEAVRSTLLPAVDRLDALHRVAGQDGHATRDEVSKLASASASLARQLLAARDYATWWKDRVPYVALGLAVLVLALSLLLPRLIAASSVGCWALGGDWSDFRDPEIKDGCEFRGP